MKTERITVQLFIDLCSIYRLLRILARGDRNSCSRCDIVFKPPADSKLAQKRQQPAAAPPTPQLHTPIKVEEKVTLAVSVICVCFFTTALTRFFLFFPFLLFLSYFSHQQPFFFNFCFSKPTFNMNSVFFFFFNFGFSEPTFNMNNALFFHFRFSLPVFDMYSTQGLFCHLKLLHNIFPLVCHLVLLWNWQWRQLCYVTMSSFCD